MSGNKLGFDLQQLAGKTVAITGASGFIGGRITQMLLQYPDIKVRPIINSYHKAIGLVRYSVNLVKADLTDYNQVLLAIKDADVVIHCAYVSKGNFAEQAANTITVCENVLKASLACGVKRVVHLSTMSVYGIETSGPLSEDIPNKKSNFFYSDAKITCEELAFKYYRDHQLPVVVIQPTIVYGPNSDLWVVGPLKQLAKSFKILPDNGDGVCNPVYIDDVAQAVLLSCTKQEAIGERFIISGPDYVTWKEFYGYFEKMLGIHSVLLEPMEAIKQKIADKNKKPGIISIVWQQLKKERTRNFLQQFVLFRILFSIVRKLLPKGAITKLKGEPSAPQDISVVSKPKIYDPLFVYRILMAKPVASIQKAKTILGYQPQYNLEKGMVYTYNWAKWAGYLKTKA